MIFTTSWLNNYPALIKQGSAAITVTAACGSSATPTTADMTGLVAQTATALSVVVNNINNRLEITATFGPGSAYTATEFGVWINATGLSPAFARWIGGPVIKGTDNYFTAIFRVDCEEGV